MVYRGRLPIAHAENRLLKKRTAEVHEGFFEDFVQFMLGDAWSEGMEEEILSKCGGGVATNCGNSQTLLPPKEGCREGLFNHGFNNLNTDGLRR